MTEPQFSQIISIDLISLKSILTVLWVVIAYLICTRSQMASARMAHVGLDYEAFKDKDKLEKRCSSFVIVL